MTKQKIQEFLQSNLLPREKVLQRLKASPNAYDLYNALTDKLKEEFLQFCEGKTSLWICYDTFFKNIFHPDMHPHRLERLLSAILGQNVTILKAMANEGIHLSDHGAFVILDIIVRLEDGSIVNLEVQKIGYRFPAKRFDCYCADLIMREYSRLRELHKKNFRYSQIPLVYTIVLFEQSPFEFRRDSEHYIHFGRIKTDTNIIPDSLIRHVYVTLDIFKKQMQNKTIDSELEAWLTLLSAQEPVQRKLNS